MLPLCVCSDVVLSSASCRDPLARRHDPLRSAMANTKFEAESSISKEIGIGVLKSCKALSLRSHQVRVPVEHGVLNEFGSQ